MCGIAGSINYSLDIPRLTKDLFHRGPDEQTTYVNENLILHHHRLAILDIGGGRQPMHYEHLTIIFNGEIYNHQDLRKKFSLNCKTNSDTETILHLYARLGTAFLNEMDGMFALAIHDKKKNEIFLARDRAGKKPIYYYSDNKSFIFSSELNALCRQLPLRLNEKHLQQFIRMGYLYKTATPYQDVYELPAASYAYVSLATARVEVKKWWTISNYYMNSSDDNFDTALNRIETSLHTAIKSRVESSDLEVGSFLSGGIDSGLVSAIAKQYNSTLKTFTVSFEGEYDEAPLAKQVADKYNTDHHEIKISFKHLTDDIEKILSNYGEPHYDDSAIPSYYVSREARKHLTVILNGDGGDEIFGGYRRYVPFTKIDFFKTAGIRKHLFAMGEKIIPASKSKISRANYLKRLLFLGSASSPLDTYLRSTTDIFEGHRDKLFFSLEDTQPELVEAFNQYASLDLTGLRKIMLLDFENILPSVLLVKMDIATMAHSLEGRSPLLCKELLEYVPSLPDNMKINGIKTKFILRQLAKKYLPAELINQPKRGFEVPLQKWVNNELKEIIADYITAGSALYPAYADKKFLNDLLNNKINCSPERRAKMLWLIFTLEVWYKKSYKQT